MVCKKCGSNNVKIDVQMVTVGTKVKHRSILTHWGRLFLIICTFGLWALTPERTGSQKMKNKKIKTCTCQDCGHSWESR